ncbi:guanylate kinase [Parabacteroides merdae]|uniref:guanylate kinase n=1 Tax=Parabacteroides merdae TaxID=46503 RepID=UPI0034A47F5F
MRKDLIRKIIAIVGPSGSGKSTFSRMLEVLGIPAVVSYTTRPMRENEQNGRDHWFVDVSQVPPQSDMMAYTRFGNYEYWTIKEQFNGLCNYVVDEKGLVYLKKVINPENIISVYLNRSESKRKESGISSERIARDDDRPPFKEEDYDYYIINEGTKEDLFEQAKLFMKYCCLFGLPEE